MGDLQADGLEEVKQERKRKSVVCIWKTKVKTASFTIGRSKGRKWI